MNDVRSGAANARPRRAQGRARVLGQRVVSPRHAAPDGLELLLVRNTSGGWDHEAFRDAVLSYATAAGIAGRSAIAAAADVGTDMLSKWFRGVNQPSDTSVRKLADAIEAPYARLLWLAGLDPDNRFGGGGEPAAALTQAEARPIVAELAAMLSPRSPLTDEDRTELEAAVSRAMDRDRQKMKARRKRA